MARVSVLSHFSLQPMDCGPGFSVQGIFQARILEWFALSPPDPGIEPGFPALQGDSLPSESPGKP